MTKWIFRHWDFFVCAWDIHWIESRDKEGTGHGYTAVLTSSIYAFLLHFPNEPFLEVPNITATRVGHFAVVESLSRDWLFCDSMNCSPPGCSVHGIFQARILEWVAISFSRGSSWPRDGTHIFCTDRWILYHWAIREAPRAFMENQKERHLHRYSLRRFKLQENRKTPKDVCLQLGILTEWVLILAHFLQLYVGITDGGLFQDSLPVYITYTTSVP